MKLGAIRFRITNEINSWNLVKAKLVQKGDLSLSISNIMPHKTKRASQSTEAFKVARLKKTFPRRFEGFLEQLEWL